MKIKAHCFAENASISPNPFKFEYKGFDFEVIAVEDNLTLRLSKTATEQDLGNLKKKAGQTNFGEGLENKLLPYKLVLTEGAQILEGLFSLLYNSIPPKFDTSNINLNLVSETEQEQKDLDIDIFPQFLGYVSMPKNKPSYKIDASMIKLIEPSSNHLPAFSFFAQAVRSWESNDNEIAFFLYFRIIDGYFSYGVKSVEDALHDKANELIQYLPYEEELKQSTKTILTEMGIPSKSINDYKGLISDIVLIRHKLTHFSSTKAKSHHSATIKFELFTINSYMHHACFSLLRDKLYDTKFS